MKKVDIYTRGLKIYNLYPLASVKLKVFDIHLFQNNRTWDRSGLNLMGFDTSQV